MGIEEQIKDILLELQPFIENDGGRIEFVSFDLKTGTVFVSLHGACTNCPMSSYTLKLGIEQNLKSRIPEVKEVQEYSS